MSPLFKKKLMKDLFVVAHIRTCQYCHTGVFWIKFQNTGKLAFDDYIFYIHLNIAVSSEKPPNHPIHTR